MYKFEISAASPAELKEMQFQFARELLKEDVQTYREVSISEDVLEKFVENTSGSTSPPPYRYDEPKVVDTTVGIGNFDSRGLPWDGRIHSDSHNKNKDGSWRNKKGVDKNVLAQVEQELLSKIKTGSITEVVRQAQHEVASPIPPAPLTPPGVVVAPMPTFEDRNKATPWENTVPQVVAPQPVQEVPKYENIVVPQGARPAHSLETFKNNLTLLLAELIEQKKIDQPWVESIKKYFGIKEIWNVLGNEAQCIELYNTFVHYGFITKVGQ